MLQPKNFILARPGMSLPLLRLGCALFSLLVASGCEWHGGEYPTAPAARLLVVHGMLAGSELQQEIIVEYARGIHEGYFRGLTPARGARVVVAGEETYEFQEDPERPGVYRATFSPVSGERYALQVRGPAGELVTSETLVPHSAQLISPGSDTTISLGGYITVRWSEVPAAAGYVLLDRPPGQPSSGATLLQPGILSETELRIQPGAFGGTTFQIRVAAVDANYRRYMRPSSDGSGEQEYRRDTVEGGHGLFGSYSLSDSRLISVQ